MKPITLEEIKRNEFEILPQRLVLPDFATYILDNVINNFTDYPDVVEEAKRELSSIKLEESKTNSSITK